jgi:hypothetical protein
MVCASFKPILAMIRIGHQGVFIFSRSGGIEVKHAFFTRSLVLVVGLMVAGSASAALIEYLFLSKALYFHYSNAEIWDFNCQSLLS